MVLIIHAWGQANNNLLLIIFFFLAKSHLMQIYYNIL